MNVCPLVVCQFPPSGPLAPDVRLCDRNGEADEPREPALWFLPWQSRLQVRQEQAATDRSLTSHHIQHSVELFIQSTLHRWERVHVQHGYLLCELNTHKHESHGGQWTTSSAKSTTWSYSVMLFHSWRTNQINWWHHVLSDVSTDRDSVQDHKQFIKKKVMIFLFTVAVLMEWNPTVSAHFSVTSVGSVFGISFSATLVCNKMFYNPYLVSYDYWLSSCHLVKTSAGGRAIWRFQWSILKASTIFFPLALLLLLFTNCTSWLGPADPSDVVN